MQNTDTYLNSIECITFSAIKYWRFLSFKTRMLLIQFSVNFIDLNKSLQIKNSLELRTLDKNN